MDLLNSKGTVLTEHIGEKSIHSGGEGHVDDKFIHDRDLEWIMSCDLLVAEVTNPSLGVGYEIGRAVENEVPVFTLYREGGENKLSAMIGGCDKIKTYYYQDEKDIERIVLNEIFPYS